MLDNDKFYNVFIKATSELNHEEGECLTKVILPESFHDDLSKKIKLQERANICNKDNLDIEVNIIEDHMNEEVKYSILVGKKMREIISSKSGRVLCSEPYMDSVKIIVSSSENPELSSVYIGRTTNKDDVYDYSFAKKTKDGIIMFKSKVEMQSVYYNYNITRVIITETIYNRDTSEIIGDAYLNPKLLAESEKYGIKCDSTTTYTDIKSLSEIYHFFVKRSEEAFRENYSKSMATGTAKGFNDGK